MLDKFAGLPFALCHAYLRKDNVLNTKILTRANIPSVKALLDYDGLFRWLLIAKNHSIWCNKVQEATESIPRLFYKNSIMKDLKVLQINVNNWEHLVVEPPAWHCVLHTQEAMTEALSQSHDNHAIETAGPRWLSFSGLQWLGQLMTMRTKAAKTCGSQP